MNMINKKLIILAICIALIVLLVAAMSVDELSKPPVSTFNIIYSVTDQEIAYVDIKNQSGEFSIERCEEKITRSDGKDLIDVIYKVKDNPGMVLSQDAVKRFLNDFYEFYTVEKVSESGDFGAYGFDGQSPSVTIVKKDGSETTFYLGSSNPEETERYVRIEGETAVHSMIKVKEESFLYDLEHYRDRRIAVLDVYTLLSFSVTDKGERKMGIRYKNIDDEIATTDAITYVMELPYMGAVNIDKFGKLMLHFEELWAEDFVEDNPENLSKYGLNPENVLRVVLQDVEQNAHIILFGNADENGNIYTMYGDRELVFTTNPDIYNTIKDLKPSEFVERYINVHDIEDVSTVYVRAADKEYVLEIKSDKDFAINGKPAIASGFDAGYQGICNLKLEEEVDSIPKETPAAEISFRLKDGRQLTSEFFEYDTRAYGVETAEGVHGLISRRFLDNILKFLEEFDKNPNVEP